MNEGNRVVEFVDGPKRGTVMSLPDYRTNSFRAMRNDSIELGPARGRVRPYAMRCDDYRVQTWVQRFWSSASVQVTAVTETASLRTYYEYPGERLTGRVFVEARSKPDFASDFQHWWQWQTERHPFSRGYREWIQCCFAEALEYAVAEIQRGPIRSVPLTVRGDIPDHLGPVMKRTVDRIRSADMSEVEWRLAILQREIGIHVDGIWKEEFVNDVKAISAAVRKHM